MPTQQSMDALLDAYGTQRQALTRVLALIEPLLNGPRKTGAEHRLERGLAHRISLAIKPSTAERQCTFDKGHDAHTYPYGPGESAVYCPGLPQV